VVEKSSEAFTNYIDYGTDMFVLFILLIFPSLCFDVLPTGPARKVLIFFKHTSATLSSLFRFQATSTIIRYTNKGTHQQLYVHIIGQTKIKKILHY